MEELRRLRFTTRRNKWDADRRTHTPGGSEIDAPFQELRQAWLRLHRNARSLIETIDQSGLVFRPVTTGTRAVREVVSLT